MRYTHLAYLAVIPFFFCAPGAAMAQKSADAPDRIYTFAGATSPEVELSAIYGVSLNNLTQDIYLNHIGPALGQGTGEKVAATTWSVFWTYFYIIWPHEMGHWLRAQQVEGEFVFHNYALPFPHTTFEDNEKTTLEEEILLSIGGFEVNAMIARDSELKFHTQGQAYADEMVHGFIHQIFFPMYAWLIFPADAKKPDTWLDTKGDPVQFVLLAYRRHTGREPVREDGTVDPELVDLYNETALMSLVWPMLNPMFYRSTRAFGYDMREDPSMDSGGMLLGDRDLGWTYGTQFRPSALGYELYFTNYISWQGKMLALYFKHGRPFKNNGAGLEIPMLYESGALDLGVKVEGWEQDLYGNGAAAYLDMSVRLTENWRLALQGGYKQKGYLTGEALEEGFKALMTLEYRYRPSFAALN